MGSHRDRPAAHRGAAPPSRSGVDDLLVFLGPSLSWEEAVALVPCRPLPPARQGDLWRAIDLHPRAIALVDGVFESQPSVWHREILAALEAGIAVFGASSMGALRAAELWRDGMLGVGTIFGWYRDGLLVDDAEVALLHAGREHHFAPMTVPLVNVRHACARALEARVLSRPEAEALFAAAGDLFYQDRTWPRLLRAVERTWRANAFERWRAWAAEGLEDLKAADARLCLREASAFVRSAAPPAPVPAARRQPSSLERRRRSAQAAAAGSTGAGPLSSSSRASARDERDTLRRLLLAGHARELGLRASEDEIRAAEARWLRERGHAPGERRALRERLGLDDAQARRFFEDLVLEQLLLEHSERVLADGPSAEEARFTSAAADASATRGPGRSGRSSRRSTGRPSSAPRPRRSPPRR